MTEDLNRRMINDYKKTMRGCSFCLKQYMVVGSLPSGLAS